MLQNLSKWTETKGAFLFVLCISAVLKVSLALPDTVMNHFCGSTLCIREFR